MQNTPIYPKDLSPLEESLIEHEGASSYAYTDTRGYITIGVGKNVDPRSHVGLTTEEMVYLMRNDIAECKKELMGHPWYDGLDFVRKDIIVELCYNMGLPTLNKFYKMKAALERRDYKDAAKELLDSLWAKQVGKHRSNTLAQRLISGKYEKRG
jgi:lysozyme